jgi:hypothetical protein
VTTHRRPAGAAGALAACAVAIAATAGCSATAIVRPLPVGTSAWTASLGGPYVPNSVPTLVVPYATIGWQRGITNDLTVGGAVHATMAAFGVAGVDVAATRRLVAQDGARPELVGTLRGTLFSDGSGSGTRFYPSLGVVGSWAAGPRTLWYAGADATAQTGATPGVLVAPLAGVQRRFGANTAFQLELKWMAANVDSRRGVFEGESSIGGRGAVAVQLGVVRYRGGSR